RPRSSRNSQPPWRRCPRRLLGATTNGPKSHCPMWPPRRRRTRRGPKSRASRATTNTKTSRGKNTGPSRCRSAHARRARVGPSLHDVEGPDGVRLGVRIIRREPRAAVRAVRPSLPSSSSLDHVAREGDGQSSQGARYQTGDCDRSRAGKVGVIVAKEVANGTAGLRADITPRHRAETEFVVELDAQLVQIDHGDVMG